MNNKIKKINNFTIELTCTVSWEDIESEFNEEFEKVKSNHTPPGGRKGKVFGAHLEMFKKNYTPAIEANFAEKSLNKYYNLAITEEKLTPISQAKVSNLDFSKGNSLIFTLNFEVMPEVKLPNYQKKFKIKMTKFIQSNEDLEMSIEELRGQHSNIKIVDTGAKTGDFIQGDFQELDDSDIPIIGKKLEKQYIKLGIGAFIDSAEKDMLGVKADEKRKVMVNYGEDKKARYEIHVLKVEEQILPELNDDFAKTVSPDLKTIDELKDRLSKNIKQSIDDDYEKRKREELINYFVTKTKFDPPESMVLRYSEKLIEEQTKKNPNVDKEKLKEDANKASDFNVRWFIIKDKILDEAKIDIKKVDIDSEIDKIVKESKEEESKVREFFNEQNNKESLANNLINEKLFKYISDFATIKDTEKSTSDLRKQK